MCAPRKTAVAHSASTITSFSCFPNCPITSGCLIIKTSCNLSCFSTKIAPFPKIYNSMLRLIKFYVVINKIDSFDSPDRFLIANPSWRYRSCISRCSHETTCNSAKRTTISNSRAIRNFEPATPHQCRQLYTVTHLPLRVVIFPVPFRATRRSRNYIRKVNPDKPY